MWLSLVERCVRDAETARSNRAIPTTWVLRVCFTANPFFMPNARRKKGILPYEEFPSARGKTTARLRPQIVVGNHRLRGQQIRSVWPARCTGNWCKPPGASCASAETANPLSSAPLPRHPCSAGGLRPQAPQPTRPDPACVPFPFGSDLPVGYDALHADAPRTRRKRIEKFRLFKRGVRVFIYKKDVTFSVHSYTSILNYRLRCTFCPCRYLSFSILRRRVYALKKECGPNLYGWRRKHAIRLYAALGGSPLPRYRHPSSSRRFYSPESGKCHHQPPFRLGSPPQGSPETVLPREWP